MRLVSFQFLILRNGKKVLLGKKCDKEGKKEEVSVSERQQHNQFYVNLPKSSSCVFSRAVLMMTQTKQW